MEMTFNIFLVPSRHTTSFRRLYDVYTISATYHLSKYLASPLSPLSESEYTVKNSKSFIQKVKLDKIPSNYKIVSFDVKSLFSNVHLDQAISIILNRIYQSTLYDKILNKKYTKSFQASSQVN